MRVVLAFARRTAPFWNMMSGLLAMAGLIGAGWAVWQYLEQKEAERQKYTLELVGIWQQEGYLESYDQLAGKVVGFMNEVPTAQLENASRDPTLKQRLQENFTRRILTDDSTLADVKRVVYFFKWIDICLRQQLCSKGTAVAFFDDTVSTFLESYGKYVEIKQPLLPASLGLLERLSKDLNDDRPHRR